MEKKREMTPILSERGIGIWLRKYSVKRGYQFIKLNPSTHNGIPDRMILTTSGHTVYVELKSKGGTLRPMQVKWMDWLGSHEFHYLLLDEINQDTVEFLDNFFDTLEQPYI